VLQPRNQEGRIKSAPGDSRALWLRKTSEPLPQAGVAKKLRTYNLNTYSIDAAVWFFNSGAFWMMNGHMRACVRSQHVG
jgi:hypothetical protein